MERGRAWSSGTAAAALTGVVLTGGATLGAATAQAAPVPPRPPVCTIGTTPYLYAPAKATPAPTIRRAVAADATGRCVDAISNDVLGPADVAGHALVRVPAARPKPAPASTTTAPKPAPATTTPAPTTTTPAPTTTTPAPTTTTTPPTGAVAPSTPARPATPGAPPVVDGAVGGAAPGTTPTVPSTAPAASGAASASSASSASSATTAAPRPHALRRSTAPATAPGRIAPAAPAAPAAVPAVGPGATATNPLAAVAPLSAVAPGDAAGVPAVEPASYLDPLGAPGVGALPGEPTILETLGGNTSGVTTSSRVQALGLDALHRGGGVPAVVGVTIMAGLGGLALRHRILQRIRTTEPAAGGPDPAEDRAPEQALVSGRHAR